MEIVVRKVGRSQIPTKEKKDRVFKALMKEHKGDEDTIDLRGVIERFQKYAWLDYDTRFDEEYIRLKLLDYLSM